MSQIIGLLLIAISLLLAGWVALFTNNEDTGNHPQKN